MSERKRRTQRRSAPPTEFTDALLESELVAVSYDEAKDRLMFPHFDTLDELFGAPELIRNGYYWSTLNNYLRDGTVSPILFRGLGQRHPGTAGPPRSHAGLAAAGRGRARATGGWLR